MRKVSATSFLNDPKYKNNLGAPPTPPTHFNKPTPLTPSDLDEPSLFELLMKIDKAIQDNDLRQYYALNTDQDIEQPLREAQCQIIDSNLIDSSAILTPAANPDAQMPMVSVLSGPSSVRNYPRSTDYTFISQYDCNLEGVREAQQDLRVRVRRYYRCFIELTRLREELATNNDVFGGDLAEIARATSEGKSQRTKLVYYHIKTKIEASIAEFVAEISELGNEMVRFQQLVIGRRMGWGYLLNNPRSDFILVIRHLPLFYGGILARNLLQSPNAQKSFNKRSESETSKISIFNTPIISDCIQEVTSLKQFSKLMASNGNKSFEIFSLKEDQELFRIKLDNLKTIFKIWFKTSRGWYYRDYWTHKFQAVKNDFGVLFRSLLKSSAEINIKLKVIKDVTQLIESQLDLSLAWYYTPENNLRIVAEFLWKQYELIRHSPSFQLKDDDDESKGDNW